MSYNIKDIKSLSFREGIRTRINMYLGSDDTNGMYQALKEIINNSTDEAIAGYGDSIEITVDKNNRITVRDYGRGVPFGIRENGENVLVSIYTKSHTGGKFDKNSYKNASGLNGIGGSAVCLSSKYFEVTSYREGKSATAKFDKGILLDYKEKATKEKNGTKIIFEPDKEVFINAEEDFSYDEICKEIKNISYLNKKLKFIVKDKVNNVKNTYCSKNGIVDFIKDKAGKTLCTQPILINEKEVKSDDSIEVAFAWTTGSEQSYVFVNGLYCPEGGSPVTGAKTAITRQIKKISGETIDGDIIRKGLIYVINCQVSEPSFANQTKTKINNPSLRTLSSQAFTKGIEQLGGTKNFNDLIKMLLKMQRAEKAADKARKQILETAKAIEKNQHKKVFNSDKLKDAEYLGQDSTLLIVEGDSAAGGIAKARDYKKYGILAIRGKILNCLSKTEEKIANNEEISLLLKAMNIVPNKYNPSKLRYGRIAICTDSDSDGFHIGLLIMAALYYFAPEFLWENRLCWLRSPLYIVKNGKEEKYFFTDQEFAKVRGTIKGEVQRNKGLGALSPEQAHNSMFTEEHQRMDIIEPSEEAISMLQQLMGDEVTPRKEYIFNNIDFNEIRE